MRPSRLGLRLQLLLSLFVAVTLAFGLLDVVAYRLGERARVVERLRSAEVAASLLAELADSPWVDLPRFLRYADSVVGHGGVRGLEVRTPNGTVFARGTPGRGRVVRVRSEGGAEARLYVETDDRGVARQQFEFLLLYVALTGGGILVLTYVVLTWLVIRPVERLRRASERLASGHLDSRVDEDGPAELAALSRSFNEMASQLRTERTALEQRLEELERTARHLREAQEQIVRTEKLASVGRLSAGVAHEIGNPLAAILGLVELLESGDLPPDEAAEFVGRIRNETERIHRIIRDLLDFARQGSDAVDARDATTELASVVREAVALVRPQKGFRDVTIACELGERPPRVRGAETRLVQVLVNLLLNAADAIDGKGHVAIELVRDGDAMVIRIDDDGPGIAAEVLPNLFEPFVTTKPVGKGTGLGLAVCHTLVAQAGGSITARNRTPRGARFEVRLPLAATERGA